ncbi:snaclec bitiscetin subunit alpha-like [Cotesia typhae]|uniref:snaclec bitiscetin subunit alpha-like n=1 Tax=Cotesia typhae TaxID=2053667 RepID=UPI003D68DC95
MVLIDYRPWGNNLYKAYNVAKNWNNAQQTCQGDNGNLAVINSREEAQFVQQLVINARPITGSTYPGSWVGFRDTLMAKLIGKHLLDKI